MNGAHYKTAQYFSVDVMTRAIDPNGAVKSPLSASDTGNGLLYTAMALALSWAHFDEFTTPLEEVWETFLKKCLNGGNLLRTPQGTYGSESWDDHIGTAVACILTNDKATPRTILWYACKHPIEAFKTWDRFPQALFMMVCAAFPWLKFVLWPLLLLIEIFATPNAGTDQSGLNLDYMYAIGLDRLYNTGAAKSIHRAAKQTAAGSVANSFKAYFGPDHPFTLLEEDFNVDS